MRWMPGSGEKSVVVRRMGKTDLNGRVALDGEGQVREGLGWAQRGSGDITYYMTCFTKINSSKWTENFQLLINLQLIDLMIVN